MVVELRIVLTSCYAEHEGLKPSGSRFREGAYENIRRSSQEVLLCRYDAGENVVWEPLALVLAATGTV